jgi:hypothetical protein
MPLQKGSSRKVISANISELHKGPQYKRTARKYGKKKANAQAAVIALKKAGKARKGKGK